MADSIKLFQFIQTCHQTIGIFPPPPGQKSSPLNWVNIIFLICCVQSVITTAVYLVFDAKSMFEYGLSFFMINAVINSIIIYLIWIWQSQSTYAFVANCEGFIGRRTQSAAAYQELTAKIELFNKFFCSALYLTYSTIFFSVLPYSMIRYFIFNMKEDSFYLFYPSWYPFDWKSFPGYLLAWLIQCLFPPSGGSMYMQFSNIFFGSCGLFIFMAKDITRDMAAFNASAKTTTSDETHRKLTRSFCDIVQNYTDAKQCIKDFNQMYQYSLFAYFLWNMLSLSSVLITLQFQLWADGSNPLETGLLVCVLIWMLIYLSVLCEPGARVTNQFEVFEHEIIQCDWYSLSTGMQQLYAIFLSDIQRPNEMRSYANITCERGTLKKVINNAFSYLMTFRNFKP